MPFTFKKLKIPEIVLVEPKFFEDERGFFMEVYKYSDFAKSGIEDNFVQDNHSRSKKGILRGLHYQKNPHAQSKLVRCARGEIFDVAVDIRRGSPTFGRWVGEYLSAENKKQLYIPGGFAHGYCALEDGTEIIYKCSQEYSPEFEKGIIWNDKTLGINWPLGNPVISEKDSGNLPFEKIDNNFIYK